MMRLAIGFVPSVAAVDAPGPQADGRLDSARERARVLAAADRYLKEQPVTVTASSSPRSAGGPHDFFSEGDYWWPDPQNPNGPYIQKDGMSNPGNFNDHRRALMRLSVQMPALTAAYTLTKDRKYADARGAARARLVRVARDADDAGAALRAGDPGPRSPAAAPASSTPSIWWRSRARSSGSTARRAGRATRRPRRAAGSPTISTG